MIAIGAKVGRWTVLSGPHRENRVSACSVNYIDVYVCRCECGVERRVRKHKLLRNSRSCGCLRAGDFKKRVLRHGHNRRDGKTKVYSVWDGMMQRCGNQNHESHHLYGGRGIGVCDEWRTFANFAAWAESSGYEPGLTLDRINSDGGYSPDNCRWATWAEQSRNKCSNRNITAFGETKCLRDWSRDPRCVVSESALGHRLRAMNLPPEDAITREDVRVRSFRGK